MLNQQQWSIATSSSAYAVTPSAVHQKQHKQQHSSNIVGEENAKQHKQQIVFSSIIKSLQ